VQRFRGGLVFKAHRLSCHSTLGFRVIKKKKLVDELDLLDKPLYMLLTALTSFGVSKVETPGLDLFLPHVYAHFFKCQACI
jgi:hypothetical protein